MTVSRAQQKEKTRRTIIDAAFHLLNQERNYANLSLREVAREAGIAPNSFYRHFEDMEELGLTLVDEGGVALRQLMRKARQRISDEGSVIRTSVEVFMEFIQDEPYQVVGEAANGVEAVRKCTGEEIDLILMDIRMPGMDGLDTYRQILAVHPEQKAIIASGFAETEDVQATQKLGAGKYIKKPFTLQTLAIAIREELKK